MGTSLLTTKLFIPPARPGLVRRSRLLERLQAGLNCGLVLISAPAGFGKTTLVSEWVHSARHRVPTAWLSLDEGDNDPVRFWDYFIATLKTLKPTAGETALSLLHAPELYPTEAVLTALINDLGDTSRDFVIVLDDYHLIKAEPVHVGIMFLLDHLPPNMHMVIASRTEPPVPLAHLRGRGSLLEIGADDLRFTAPEAAVLLKRLQSVALAAEDVVALNARTEGWAVGLTMAALSLGKHEDIAGFIASFTGSQRHVMDYLVEQVLGQQPAEVLDFLLKTSVLERLTAPLCDYLTDRGDGREMLEKLESTMGGFLIPLDESRQWYRYHHLFAELLHHQLEDACGEEEVMRLNQKASRWYEDHAFPDDAIRHALVSCDWGRAIRLVYAQSDERLRRAEWNTLLGWLRAIPDEVLRTHHQLYSQYSNALVRSGQLEAAEAALSYLERTAQGDTFLQGEVALFQTMLAERRGDIPRMIEMGEKTLSLLPPDNLAMRARVSYLLGFVQYSRCLLEEAQLLYSDAYEMGFHGGEYWSGAGGAAGLGTVLMQRGRLREALEITKEAVDLAGPSPAVAMPQAMLARVLYELNDLKGASESARQGVELSEFGGLANALLSSSFWLSQTLLAQGEIAGATAAIEKLDQAARLPGVARSHRAYHAGWRVMFALRQGNLALARDWGHRLQEYASILPFDARTIAAYLLIAQGERNAAMEQLQDLYETASRSQARGFMIQIRVCQTKAAATPAEALTFMTDALTLGQPEGFIRSFVDAGTRLTPLLRKALAQGVTPEYTRKLLNIIEAEERQRKIRRGEVPALPQTSGLLSKRETEVLRLLMEGVSNQDIAARLFISLYTAKTHVRHCFDKLEVRNRTQAVAKARALKLL